MFGKYFWVFPSIWLWFEPRVSTSTQKITISNFKRARTHTFPSGNRRALSGSKFDTTLLNNLIFLQYSKRYCVHILNWHIFDSITSWHYNTHDVHDKSSRPRKLICAITSHYRVSEWMFDNVEYFYDFDE